MEVGKISDDGYYQWDGQKWNPVELATVSDDGYWIWDGEKWVANRQVQTEIHLQNQSNMVMAQWTVQTTSPAVSQNLVYIQQGQHGSVTAGKISLIFLIPVVVIALMVVLSGVLYVWASSLADESIYSDNDRSIAGTWYNPNDTITFYPNGTVLESTEAVLKWSVDNKNLTTTFQIGEDEIDIVWIYEIKYDNAGDSFLFMALYEIEDGVQINTVNESSCIGYSDSIARADDIMFEEIVLIFPEWCNPEEN